jgi:hypothetical protein
MYIGLAMLLPSLLLLMAADLRAGAAQVDINPRTFPVVINCGFLERSATEVKGDLFARSVVLDDGGTRIAITVVDSCMMPRELIDRAKQLASEKAGIPVDRMMISATHTHSAPAAMACLGSRQQKDYAEWLPGRIAEVIIQAASKLEPARVGATSVDAPEHTFCRRWIYKPEKMLKDPFGEVSVRANMIPGFENPDVVSPSGPVDTELSIVSIQSKSGSPIAILANFGNHYFGTAAVSPDYFGIFDRNLAAKVGGGIVMMSQGTSGDANTSNYAKPKATWTIDEYANGLVDLAYGAYRNIRYTSGTPIRMAETLLPLGRRLASPKRLEWAGEMVRNQKGDKPANQPEVYAHEQIFIRDTPKRELRLQAIRIGEIALTAIPNEVFALTGLKLKMQSPLKRTINIELANGAEGYIPPPEQHLFGGYTTWAARSAGLETTAEPKIVGTLLGLLEKVADAKRRRPEDAPSKDIAHWRLDDFEYGTVKDSAGRFPARHEGRLALYLPGSTAGSRAVYLAGGSIQAQVDVKSDRLGIEFTFWPSVDPKGVVLVKWNDAETPLALPEGLALQQWHRARLSKDGSTIRAYVDDKLIREVQGNLAPVRTLTVGSGFEGKIDDIRLVRVSAH